MNSDVGWKALYSTPGNRKRMIIAIAIGWFSQWSGNGLVSYYLNKVFDTIGITSTSKQLLITGSVSRQLVFRSLTCSQDPRNLEPHHICISLIPRRSHRSSSPLPLGNGRQPRVLHSSNDLFGAIRIAPTTRCGPFGDCVHLPLLCLL